MSKSLQPSSHGAMARAGLMLLAAAANRMGDGLPDDATETQFEERQAWHIHTAGFNQGFEDGHSAGAKAVLQHLTDALIGHRDGGAAEVSDA